MGDPRKLRKKYVGPKHPWRKQRIISEMPLMGKYGLRNKREIWKAQTQLRRYRSRARKLLALPEEIREQERHVLARKLYNLGLLESEDAPIDSILSLSVENFLDRRLQTMVYRLGLARTPYEARQLIVHRHITVKGRVVTVPSYHVMRGEESEIDYRSGSPYANPDHPMRQDLRGRVVKVTSTGESETIPTTPPSSTLPPEVAEEIVSDEVLVEEDEEVDESVEETD